MSDIKVLEDKIDGVMVEIQKVESKLDTEIGKVDRHFEEVDNRLDGHAECVRSLIQWRDSNGSPGAEERLRKVEGCTIDIEKEKLPVRMLHAEADIRILQNISDATMRSAFSATLDERSKTTIERIKAFGPIVAALFAAAAAVLSAVL